MSDTIAPNSSGGEVIINSPPSSQKPKQTPCRKHHFITWFYKSTDEIAPVIHRCKELCYKGIVQTEVCPTTMRPHMHLMLWGKNKFRDTELKLPKNTYRGEPLRDYENISDYANKEVTHDGVFRDKWGFPEPLQHYCMFNTWQLYIIDTIQSTPDKRNIHWFWSESGKLGKTALTRWCIDKYNSQFCTGGKYTDIMNLIYHTDMDRCKSIFFTLPREHKNHISYSALESVKDGLVCNMKSYKNGSKIFNPPHIFVFANYPPDESKMSSDRWIIFQIDYLAPARR